MAKKRTNHEVVTDSRQRFEEFRLFFDQCPQGLENYLPNNFRHLIVNNNVLPAFPLISFLN